jgi:CBS domain-containing protein
MLRRGCGCLPVVDGEKRLVGILTDRDVCRIAQHTDEPLSRLRARAALSAPVHTCTPDTSVADAEASMARHQVRRLPVLDARGGLVGLLSLDDIAREARSEESLIRPAVSSEGVGRTLGAIVRPRIEAWP